MQDWSKEKGRIKKAFMEDGVKAFIRQKTYGEYDVTTGKKTASSSIKETVYAIFKSYENESSGNIPADEFDVMCSYTLRTDPEDTKTHFFVYEEPVRPGGEVLFYNLRCQR
jgi:hypothetical protein